MFLPYPSGTVLTLVQAQIPRSRPGARTKGAGRGAAAAAAASVADDAARAAKCAINAEFFEVVFSADSSINQSNFFQHETTCRRKGNQ